MLPSLPTLLDPLTLSQFRERYWQRQHYVTKAKHGLVKRLAKELYDFNVSKLLEHYSGPVQAWFRTPAGAFRAAEITANSASAVHDAGATLYLHQLGLPALTEWQLRLARELGHSQKAVTCSVFAGTQGAGTRCHFDSLENFTIQLKGRKIWHVSQNHHVRSPLENWVTGTALPDEMSLYCESLLPRDMPNRKKTIELSPGDILYVPRGYWHSTEASVDSFSLFLGFAVTPCVDLILNSIRSHLLRSSMWRENFIDATASRNWESRARRQVEHLLRSLKEDVSKLTTKDVIAGQSEVVSIQDSTLFQRNPISTLQVRLPSAKPVTDAVVIFHRGRFSSQHNITVRQQLVPLCLWISRKKRPFQTADAAAQAQGLPKEAVRNLLRILCKCGFLSCRAGIRTKS